MDVRDAFAASRQPTRGASGRCRGCRRLTGGRSPISMTGRAPSARRPPSPSVLPAQRASRAASCQQRRGIALTAAADGPSATTNASSKPSRRRPRACAAEDRRRARGGRDQTAQVDGTVGARSARAQRPAVPRTCQPARAMAMTRPCATSRARLCTREIEQRRRSAGVAGAAGPMRARRRAPARTDRADRRAASAAVRSSCPSAVQRQQQRARVARRRRSAPFASSRPMRASQASNSGAGRRSVRCRRPRTS